MTRPVLGTEPGAALLGGVSGSFSSELGWMNGILDVLPGLEYDGVSTLSVSGEAAVSVPNPNTRKRTFVDDFDAASELPVSLESTRWLLGSAPGFRDGVETVLPTQVDGATASSLIWQDSWIVESVSGDSVGVTRVTSPAPTSTTRSAWPAPRCGSPVSDSRSGVPPRAVPVGWRSVTTTLATNGLDLTKTEFLEFYAAGSGQLSLVLDLGTTSEDAFFVDGLGNTSGPRQGGGQWGLTFLDQEADPRRGEIWNDAGRRAWRLGRELPRRAGPHLPHWRRAGSLYARKRSTPTPKTWTPTGISTPSSATCATWCP